MKLLKAEVTNFGSYEYLEFDFSENGLAIITGATGSGKSTLQDIPSWILFGVTAKDGGVDEIRSWVTPSTPTTGKIKVLTPSGDLEVTRVRGKPSENDLYWLIGNSDVKHRGKDLLDSQKQLEGILGVKKEVFLSGAYFNEFSKTGSFFTSNAKDRKALFEKIAPLELPAKIAEAAANNKKQQKVIIKKLEDERQKLDGKLETLQTSYTSSIDASIEWQDKQDAYIYELKTKHEHYAMEKTSKIQVLNTKIARFEEEKVKKLNNLQTKIDSLKNKTKNESALEAEYRALPDMDKCPTCQGDAHMVRKSYLSSKLREMREFNNKIAELSDMLEEEKSSKSHYESQLKDLEGQESHYPALIERESLKPNPFLNQVEKTQQAIENTNAAITTITADLERALDKFNLLDKLYDLSFDLRGVLLQKAIKGIQDETNQHLDTYFDSEIRVQFELEGSDNLNINVQKNGYPCVYSQLSKGQRQLLKLCFVISVMKAAQNHSGVHISTLFFDEALDGLDANLKIKAFSLFTELSTQYESIFMIEHTTEIKSLFSTQYHVTIESDRSMVEKLHE